MVVEDRVGQGGGADADVLPFEIDHLPQKVFAVSGDDREVRVLSLQADLGDRPVLRVGRPDGGRLRVSARVAVSWD